MHCCSHLDKNQNMLAGNSSEMHRWEGLSWERFISHGQQLLILLYFSLCALGEFLPSLLFPKAGEWICVWPGDNKATHKNKWSFLWWGEIALCPSTDMLKSAFCSHFLPLTFHGDSWGAKAHHQIVRRDFGVIQTHFLPWVFPHSQVPTTGLGTYLRFVQKQNKLCLLFLPQPGYKCSQCPSGGKTEYQDVPAFKTRKSLGKAKWIKISSLALEFLLIPSFSHIPACAMCFASSKLS